MRKWIPAFLIVASYAFSVLVYAQLPQQVAPQWDALWPWVLGDAGDAMPRAAAAFGIPTLALAIWLLLRVVASPTGEHLGRRIFPAWLVSARTGASAVARFGPTFDLIVTVVVGFVLLFHAVMLGTVLNWPGWTLRVFTALVGLGIMVLGNVMPRTRPNWIAGLRTKRTLSDPDIWRRTHRYFGGLLIVTGIAVVTASWLAAPYAIPTAILGVLVSAVTATAIARSGGAPGAAGRPPAALVALIVAGTIRLPAQAVPPAPPTNVVEQPLDVTSHGLVLPGTLALPSTFRGTIPVAVLVAGSGPTDRNGNGPLTQTDLYAQLAHQLAQRGIASVRYDKRGIGEGSRALDHAALTLDDFVTDVAAVARVVAADRRFSRVFLIGHSEGAGLVLQAANRGAPTSGIAMLSGIGRPLREVLHDQFSLVVDRATVARIDSAFARFIQGEEVPHAPDIARPVLVPGYRRLIASMAAYDPELEIARAQVPVLIVEGGMDLQVAPEDAERLRAAQPSAGSLLIPTANHVFKAASSREPPAQLPLYRDRTIPIVPELAAGIGAWIGSMR